MVDSSRINNELALRELEIAFSAREAALMESLPSWQLHAGAVDSLVASGAVRMHGIEKWSRHFATKARGRDGDLNIGFVLRMIVILVVAVHMEAGASRGRGRQGNGALASTVRNGSSGLMRLEVMICRAGTHDII